MTGASHNCGMPPFLYMPTNNLPEWMKIAFVFLLGLEFGSFANVCIYRWPRNASVVRPRRSFCPWCNVSIAWFDNIPVLSFFLLRARCRHCRSPISFRYPAVELSVALLWLLIYLRLGPATSWQDLGFLAGILMLAFSAVVTTMTDLDWRLIPDSATATLIVAGLATSWLNPILGATWVDRVANALIGFTVGGGTIWLIGYIGERLFGKEAMGGGDVKLVAAVGTVLGWEGALAVLFFGAIVGGIVVVGGLLTGKLRRHQYIPFGPFLNFASIFIVLAFGQQLKTVDILGLRILM